MKKVCHRSFQGNFQTEIENEDFDWICTLQLPDRHAAAVQERSVPDEESAATAVETHHHMLQFHKN